MIELRRATPKAIRYACIHFHYARRIPPVSYGYNVYENGEWCGVILFSPGATVNISKMFDLAQGEVLELVRVALNGKQTKTSQCVSAALRQLHHDAPYVKIVISFADPNQGHVGTIYQATNWLYIGTTEQFSNGRKCDYYVIFGQTYHPRSLHGKGYRQSLKWLRENVDPSASEFYGMYKHKYIFIFDKRLRRKWQKRTLPYPKGVNENDRSPMEAQNPKRVQRGRNL